MKKYLGAAINIYIATMIPLLIVVCIGFSFVALSSEFSFATIFIAATCVTAAVLLAYLLKKSAYEFYSWGYFDDKEVTVKNLFLKNYSITYDKCKSCGIAYYIHGYQGREVGFKYTYIFLSCDYFDEQYRTNLNYWHPLDRGIKVGYSENLYNFLIEVLPKEQSKMLQADYRKYIGIRTKKKGDAR